MNGISNGGAFAMGESLRHNSSLVDVDISYNRVHDEGVERLIKGLKKNDTLRTLKVLSISLDSRTLSRSTQKLKNRIMYILFDPNADAVQSVNLHRCYEVANRHSRKPQQCFGTCRSFGKTTHSIWLELVLTKGTLHIITCSLLTRLFHSTSKAWTPLMTYARDAPTSSFCTPHWFTRRGKKVRLICSRTL